MDESPTKPGGPRLKTRDDDARGTPPGTGTVTPAHGGRIGTPPYVPTAEDREKVRSYAKVFPPAAQHYIATLMKISQSTLTRHYREDLEQGRAEMIAAIGAQMISRAMDGSKVHKGDLDAQKFVLARLGGWSQKHEVSGPNGGPIETVDLSLLTAEQLEAYGRLSATVAGIDPDTIIAVPR